MANKERCYNMIYHAISCFKIYVYILFAHQKFASKPDIGAKYSVQKKKCACMHRGSALRSVQFLQNDEKSYIVSNCE